MIAYEVLVQTIADWKAGARPTAPTPPPAGTPEAFEELASGVVDFEDADLGDELEVAAEEAEESEESEDYEVAYGEDDGGYAQDPAEAGSGEYQGNAEYQGSGEYQGNAEYQGSGEYHEAAVDPTEAAYVDDDEDERS
jgi:hypothetical protein